MTCYRWKPQWSVSTADSPLSFRKHYPARKGWLFHLKEGRAQEESEDWLVLMCCGPKHCWGCIRVRGIDSHEGLALCLEQLKLHIYGIPVLGLCDMRVENSASVKNDADGWKAELWEESERLILKPSDRRKSSSVKHNIQFITTAFMEIAI